MRVGNPHHSETGFSLIELMIASVILLMGVTSVMSMVLFALSANYASRVESAALRLSQQKLEELRSLPIDDTKLLGPGNPLDAESNIEFSASLDTGYSSSSSLTLNRTKNTTLHFETRWNVAAQGARKTITVATRKTDGNLYSFKPVNLKVVKSP
jgi:prepilin-type N-terminal cleavage/methylation domain-containing protein